MIAFRDLLTGVELLVADDRKDEYLAAGYKLAAEPIENEPINPPEEPQEVPEEIPEEKTEEIPEEKPKAVKGKTKSSKKK